MTDEKDEYNTHQNTSQIDLTVGLVVSTSSGVSKPEENMDKLLFRIWSLCAILT